MATIFLKITGATGDVTAQAFTGQIEVDDVVFGMSRQVKDATNSDENREAGTPYVGAVTFTKLEDSASPVLKSHHYKNIAFDEAVFNYVRTSSGTEAYRIVELDDVIISDLEHIGPGGDDRPTETLSLNFTKIHVTDYLTTDKGTNGTSSTAGYDLALAIPD